VPVAGTWRPRATGRKAEAARRITLFLGLNWTVRQPSERMKVIFHSARRVSLLFWLRTRSAHAPHPYSAHSTSNVLFRIQMTNGGAALLFDCTSPDVSLCQPRNGFFNHWPKLSMTDAQIVGDATVSIRFLCAVLLTDYWPIGCAYPQT
jgi:hypothetical protein